MGRNFGLMVIKDSFRNKILWHKFVRTETIADYLKGVEFLRSHGFIIHDIVCDGLRGLFQSLRQYKVQICQFHQIMIIRHYLTKKPDMKATQELLAISKMITHTDKEGFIRILEKWHEQWSNFIKERTIDRKSGKSTYTYPRLRSAYLSLKRNLKWLWTFQDYPKSHLTRRKDLVTWTRYHS